MIKLDDKRTEKLIKVLRNNFINYYEVIYNYNP
jgi:hypothetical protein